jgi:hypothetical protein
MRTKIFAILVTAVCITAPCVAGQDTDGIVNNGPNSRYLTKKPGYWQPRSYLGEHGAGATKAEVQIIDENLKKVQTLLMETPTGAHPMGFYFKPAGIWVNEGKGQPIRQGIGIYPLAIVEHRDHDTWKQDMGGETQGSHYYINQLTDIEHASPKLMDEVLPREIFHPLFAPPELKGTIGGFPVYGDTLYIARPGHPLWKPVTVERALKVAMPRYLEARSMAERSLEDNKKHAVELQTGDFERSSLENFEKDWGYLRAKDPKDYEERKRQWMGPVLRQKNEGLIAANPQRGEKTGDWYWGPIDALTAVQKQVAELTPQQAAAPACLEDLNTANGHEWKTIRIGVKGSSAACQDLLEVNTEYFDRSLPRTAIQLITVDRISCVALHGGTMAPSSDHTSSGGCAIHAAMWRELNWQKLADLLVK